MNKFSKATLPVAVALVTAVPALAQETDPFASLQEGANEKILAIGVMAGVLAVAVIGIKAIPVALTWILSFVKK